MRLNKPKRKVETILSSNAGFFTLSPPIFALAPDFVVSVQGSAQAPEFFTYTMEEL